MALMPLLGEMNKRYVEEVQDGLIFAFGMKENTHMLHREAGLFRPICMLVVVAQVVLRCGNL